MTARGRIDARDESLPEPLELDDLPRHSPWPARLLRTASYPARVKSPADVTREFGTEKWGVILERARRSGDYSLDALEAWDELDVIEPFYEDGELLLASRRHAQARHLERLESALRPFARDATALVELGAGYGAKIMRLARRPPFVDLPVVAAEFTASGRELLARVAALAGARATVGACDFFTHAIDIEIPPGALIFTCFALHYVREVKVTLPAWLASMRPTAVVHCEPCLEHYDSGSLHDLLCAEYVRLNGYSLNIASVFDTAERSGTIDVIGREPKAIGLNPLLPASIITWRPRERTT